MYLPQNPVLLSGHITDIYKHNILNQLTTEINLNLDSFTDIGENNKFISGGEAQKIALLKLLLENNKKIFILDELTAAIDIDSEIKLCTQLKQYLSNKTVIIITHRKPLLNICDEIISLDEKSS